MKWGEDELEYFIRKHREEFDKYNANNYHEEKFLSKLSKRFKKIISIIPHLFLVFVITFIIFVASIWIWNSYLRKDRYEITFKQKIENIIHLKK